MSRVDFLMIVLWAVCVPLLLAPSLAAANDSLQPEGWSDDIRLQEVVDLNPDPAIVEINMEARLSTVEIEEDVEVEAWTYNGNHSGAADSRSGR